MNRCFLLLVVVGLICLDGPSPAHGADVKPIQVIDADCYGSARHLSPDGKHLFWFNPSTVARVGLTDSKKVEKRPLARNLSREEIRRAVHIENDIWFLSLSRSKYLTAQDGCEDRYILYDFATETIKADWAAHKSGGDLLAFDAKRNRLITAGSYTEGLAVCYWDRKTLKKVTEFDVAKELGLKDEPDSPISIKQMSLDPTASYLAFGYNKGVIQVRDVTKHKWHIVSSKDGRYVLKSLCFLDNRTLAAGRYNLQGAHVEVYDWKTTKSLFRVDLRDGLTGIAALPDGTLLAVGDHRYKGWFFSGCYIRLWDVKAKREIAAFTAYEKDMYEMTFSSDGKRLVTSGDDGIVKVWDVEGIVKPPKP